MPSFKANATLFFFECGKEKTYSEKVNTKSGALREYSRCIDSSITSCCDVLNSVKFCELRVVCFAVRNLNLIQENSSLTSDSRGQTEETTVMLTPQVPSQTSYANTVARNVRPWKEQAIIVEAIDDYSIEDYIDGLENLIEPTEK